MSLFMLKSEVLKAQNVPLNEAEIKAFVDRHNYWRKKVGTEPVEWSEELANYAAEWGKELARRGGKMQHRPEKGRFAQKYGENIFMSWGAERSPEFVVDDWAEERQYYRGGKITMSNFSKVGHYTQMVWYSTKKIGAARVRVGDKEIWICNYDPSGNYIGEKAY